MPKIYSKAGDIDGMRRTAIGGAKLMLMYLMKKRAGSVTLFTQGTVGIQMY
jgi:hypothetical protein